MREGDDNYSPPYTEKVKEMIMLKMIMTILRSVMMTLIMIGERRDKRKASGRKDRI